MKYNLIINNSLFINYYGNKSVTKIGLEKKLYPA